MIKDISEVSWPGWETVRVLGRGSFGAVYEIQRDVLGETEKAALKVISIPQNESEIQELQNDGLDDESITETFHAYLKSIVNEYSLMRRLNECSNVVHCDDVRYEKKKDGIGWDIYIKMELLIPLAQALPEIISDQSVIRFAKQMCNALILCEKQNIIHRDIKPQNMFMTPNGTCKLGDFGIAKTVEKTMGGTKIGTFKYMAPEVYNNQPYGASADIYSLGLVLYWMLNHRRLPFMPLPPEKVLAGMDGEAANRRMRGERFPAPANGSLELKQIVMKACAFDPKDRYKNATEMLTALENIGKQSNAPIIASEATVPVRKPQQISYNVSYVGSTPNISKDAPASQYAAPKKTVSPSNTKSGNSSNSYNRRTNRKRKGLIATISIIILLIVVFSAIGIGFLFKNISKAFSSSITKPTGTTNLDDVWPDYVLDQNDANLDNNLINVGDIITFGSYEQDNDLKNGKESIEWQVLDIQNDSILLISKYALDCKPYNTSYANATWETCTLRTWLNNDFYNNSFTPAEQEIIFTSDVPAQGNPSFHTDPGNDTVDKVFLLSIQEADNLFSSDAARVCTPTQYAISNGVVTEGGTCWWWLRSSGEKQDNAARVRDTGGVSELGYFVNITVTAVRPVIQISAQGLSDYGYSKCEKDDVQSDANETQPSEPTIENPSEPEPTEETVILDQPEWTDWLEELPADVSEEKYDIEEKILYSFRELETTTSTSSNKMDDWELFDTVTADGEYGPWSDWSTTHVSSSDTREVGNETRYRYQDKQTTTSSSSTKSGWTLYDTTYSWSNYGSWSSWSSTPVSDSESRKVDSKKQYRYRSISYSTEYTNWGYWSDWQDSSVTETELKDVETRTVWPYYYFQCPNCGAHMHAWSYPCYTWAGGCGYSKIPEWSWTEVYLPVSWDDAGLTEFHGTGKYVATIDGERVFKWSNASTKTQYRYRTRSTTQVENYGNWSSWGDTAYSTSSSRDVQSRTVYRYCDRSRIPTYHFYRWGSWSTWSTSKAYSSDTRNVETATFYRYRDRVKVTTYYFKRWTDWSEYSENVVYSSDYVDVKTKKQYRYKSKTL